MLPGRSSGVRRKLKTAPDGDRQMVEVLGAVLTDGLPAVEAACAEALEGRRPLRRRHPQHPLPPPRPRTAGDDHDPEALRLRHEPRRRLRPLRQPQEGERMMERSAIMTTMGDLKLFGMRSAYDEIVASAVKRQHEPQRVVSDLLTAELAEKQARSIKYQIAIARLPMAKGRSTSSSSTPRRSTRPWSATSPAASSQQRNWC